MAKKKKRYYTLEPYDAEALEWIAKRVNDLHERFPNLSSQEIRIREIIGRYKGEAGLSETKVLYLTSCIMRVLNDHNEKIVREMGETWY